MVAFEAPQGYQANIKNAAGIEYSTWGTYEGENRRTGAALSFFVNKTAADTGKNKLADTATVRIYDASNVQVRTLRTKADSGFNRFYWGMEGKGIRQAGGGRGRRGGGGAAENEPGGLPVDPGTYKVVFSLSKDHADSTLVTVNDDPNAPLSKEIRDAIRKANARLDKQSLKLTSLVDRLTEADEIIKKVEANLKDMDQKQADTLRKLGKAVQDGLKAIREQLNGKPQEKQGYGNVPQVTVNSVLSEARSYVLGKRIAPGAQEDRLMKDAEDMVSDVISKANSFFDGKWKEYRALAESTPVKMFKEYKAID